jgi:leukotriene-A4 hydrolase
MSSNKTSVENYELEFRKHSFSCDLPIPSYLVAIIAGNVEEKQVGERTYVIAEPDMIEKSVHDLADLE